MQWSEERTKRLWQRQNIVRHIRDYFFSEGFLEAETPLHVKGTCPDAYIDSMEVAGGYLVTSTEYQIKRMIIGGFDKVFTLTKNFRAHDVGRFHSQEFTMLEWARTGKTLDAIEDDVQHILTQLAPNLKPCIRLTVRDAFKRHLGLENLEDFSLDPLIKACRRADVELPAGFTEDKYLLMSYLFGELQKHLGYDTPTFLRDWPFYLTTSAPRTAHDPYAAERSELYMNGCEIADGFPFLTDAALQKKLFQEELELRKHYNKPTVTLDEKFLQELATGMPEGAGMALGVDRLVMILTGASSLAEVQAFTWDEL